ncbi:uncharacterized protein LOC107680645 isoform X1 [Sinocyclocheilus anshuiensis]|uniref:uncharacterized protein LOC107680645 isoform X1 n=1 Tax=Sinocyclocheilus anshuiensis TaxID=1608454 RepID=UPI0007B7C93B|nr:PREDICTED: uncharacterized protein LOC107680645 isoform X1 [Sinocyclocheilus anshuiensis]XP_016332123.1 PREDICTED: uncharacterized protein LOC107680645 isoform X1 [Sinocyclocheilus anshuiensis]
MLTFETLLVKELQKQQSRAEFCDIVLQTRGVSVPVHSCVLSAFSPWLCGALSAMPSLRNGQRRLIEVQALEACTLLSLVSLLYSGQLNEDKEEVLSAACKLGIDIPQQVSKRPATERNTQTECMKEMAERECQTEAVPSECQNPKEIIESVHLIGTSSWRTDQGLCTYTDGSDITLATLQNIQGNPENMPSFQVMDVVPENAVYPTVSGPASLPQVYVCPSSASHQQPPNPLPPHPYPSHSTNVEPLAREGQPALGGILEGEECVLEAFARFENNIPGFINYFLDTNIVQSAGQREQSQRGMRGDVKTEGRVRRAGARGGFALKGEGLRICKREQNMNRYGRVARSAWMGQGGGRVGRMLDTRQMFKNQEMLKRRRQGRGAKKEEGEGGRSRGRPRQRHTGSRGRLVEPVCQDTAPPQRRRRGRPRKRPLPKPDVSQNFSGISPPDQKTLNPPALSMLHTAALPAANQTSLTQPMDWLIDDVIAQLPFMPSNQNGITVDSNMDHTRTQSSVKLTDLGIIQPQSEGELTDILDSFLRTFEQHVGVCDSDVQDGMVPNITDGTRTCGQTYTVHTNAHATSVNTTTQGSKASLSKNRPRVSSARRPQKPSRFWQVSGVKMEKSTGQQSEQKPKSGRMTRSQSRKRKLDVIEELPRRDELPTKRKRKRKEEQTEKTKVDASLLKEKKRKKKTSRLHSEEKCTGSTADSSCSVASTLSKVINAASGQNVKCVTQTTKALDRSKSSELHAHKVSSLVKEKQVGHAKRDTSETLLEGSTLKVQCSTGSSQPKLSATKNKSTGSRPALSAFELMKKILENHQKREEEHKGKDNRMWTVKRQKGKERLTNAHVRGAEVKMTENKEKNARIRVEGHNKSRINQKDKERSGRIKEAGNQKNIFLQQNLPSANGCSMSKVERLMEDDYSKPRSETADSLNDSPLQRCSTEGIVLKNTADKSFVSHAQEPTTPLEKLGNPQGSIAISEEDEDVDVVEVSSSLSESFSVPPITADIVLSTEDSDEDDEIDVISLGSN